MAPAAVQPPEIQFAQRLAANEKRIRDRALKKLRGYISVRTQRPDGRAWLGTALSGPSLLGAGGTGGDPGGAGGRGQRRGRGGAGGAAAPSGRRGERKHVWPGAGTRLRLPDPAPCGRHLRALGRLLLLVVLVFITAIIINVWISSQKVFASVILQAPSAPPTALSRAGTLWDPHP